MKRSLQFTGLTFLASLNPSAIFARGAQSGAGKKLFANFRFGASCLIIICAGLFCASHVLAQGGDTPTGIAGGFGGSIDTGGGSVDPYERHARRWVTDIAVPGAVVPFTYSHLAHSFGGTGHNWRWNIYINENSSTEFPDPPNPNDLFYGYIVYYPDGRVAKFNKPTTPAHAPPATPGTYTNAFGIVDRFVIDSDSAHGHLFMEDGSVLNFDVNPNWSILKVTSLVDPQGRAVTFTYDTAAPWGMKVTEPGGRWIYISGQVWSGNTGTTVVNTSLGQSVTYTMIQGASGSYPDPAGPAAPDDGYYTPGVLTSLGTLTYNDVPDPTTGQPLQAQYVFKSVQPIDPNKQPSDPEPSAFYRLIWASDPMFEGPLQQIKYIFVDNCTGATLSNGDNSRIAVREERWAAGADDVGVMVSRVEMPPNPTWSQTAGYSETYYTRKETRGDGATRTFSYYNPSKPIASRGQMLVDHFTDFTNNLNQTERREYDWTHLFQTPTKITDMRQNVTLQTLESVVGHITKETHPDTNYLSWTYTDPAKPYFVATAKDQLLRTTTFTRDPVTHRVTRIDYPGGTFETFVYNSFGQVTDHQLTSGAHEYQTFDSRGLRTSSWDSVSNEVTTYTYDSLDRLQTIRDARATALGIPYSMKYEYNPRHQITKIHYPATGGSPDPTVTNTYDKWGRCTSTTDELGNTRTKVYDDYGRVTSLTESLNSPSWNGTGTVTSRTWNWTYERVRNGTTYAANTHTAKEWRTQTEPAFDKDGNRRMTIREYDVNNRLVTEQTGWIVSAQGTATFGPDGETHTFTYDANGNKASHTDPLNRLTTYGYDSRNRLTTTTEPLSRITTTAYDVTSNKTLVTFPDTKTQQWLDYDAFGQPGRFIDERNNTTNLTYQWGRMKKLATVTTHRDKDAGGTEDQLTTFSYDATGRPTRTLFPDGTDEVTTYQYGEVKTWKVRKGATKTIDPLTRRDARGRELSHTWSDATPGITRTWDDAGRVTSLTNNFSTIGYTYDQAGQVITETNTVVGAGGTTTLTTNRYPDGTPATLTYPNGFKLRRDYTARGQLLKAGSADSNGNWLTQFVTYNYRADGDVNYEDFGNGVRTAFAYDARGFTNLVNTYRLSPAQTYSSRTYYRDTRDRIFAWKKSTNISANPMEDGRGDRYTYDAEGQLTAASYQALTPDTTPTGAQRTESFVFDQLGNRKGVNTIAGRGNVTFARRDTGVNQYLNWSPPMASTNYETNGVLTQDGYITATYNALNQPVSISSPALPAGTYTWFGYDPLGRCVKRWNGASGTPASNPATYFYYDGWNLIQEGANSSTAGRIYAHGTRVDEIVASQAGGQWAYHHYDARSHCILLTNASGGLLEQYDYDAFGKPYFYNASGVSQTSSGWGNRFLFTGREWLSDLKVYDFRNRHYLPELGRFIQPDPKQFEAGDYNLYRYCHNDPVNKSDPTGLATWVGSDEYTKKKDTTDSTHLEFSTESRIPRIVPNEGSNLSVAQVGSNKPMSLEGTNSKIAIPKTQYDTPKKAGIAGADAEYSGVKREPNHEIIGPIGQVDGAKKVAYFPGPAERGIGIIRTGKYAGDQGSRIDHLTELLPQGSHLVGYYTVHIYYDASRLKNPDAPRFQAYWGVKPFIVMKSPGYGQNWDAPKYSFYP